MRPRGVLRVRRPGLGAYWTSGQNWTVRVAGAVALEVRSVYGACLPRPTAAAAVGEDSMATNGDRKARGGLYT